jgi:hypothetical protein
MFCPQCGAKGYGGCEVALRGRIRYKSGLIDLPGLY